MNSKDDFWGFMNTYVPVAVERLSFVDLLHTPEFGDSYRTFMDTFYPVNVPSYWVLGNVVSRGGKQL